MKDQEFFCGFCHLFSRNLTLWCQSAGADTQLWLLLPNPQPFGSVDGILKDFNSVGHLFGLAPLFYFPMPFSFALWLFASGSDAGVCACVWTIVHSL